MGSARKQSKTSWRKRARPIEDEALERRRATNQDRRTGGSVSALADSELFSIGVGVEEARPRRKQQKMLHVDRILAPNPNIMPAVAERTAPSKLGLAPQLCSKLSKLSKAAKATKAAKAQQLANKAATSAVTMPPTATSSAELDIWGAGSIAAAVPVTRRRAPERTTVSTAVVVAPEGASWNPVESARQELVSKAVAHEVERLRKGKLARSRAFTRQADSDDEDAGAGEEPEVPIDRTPRDHTLVGGEVDTRDSDDEEEKKEDEDVMLPHAPKEKLTAVQRNKRKLALEREKAAAEAKRRRKAEKQLGREGALLAELRKADKALEAKRYAEAAHEARRIKRLGKIKYEPKRPEVLLSDELPASLRQLPAGTAELSLLNDRYDSMQARNLIEARQMQPKKRKTNRKQVMRESCKDIKYQSPHFKGEFPAWL